MTTDEVINVVAEYDFGNKNGIGLLFVVDVLDYTKQKSVVHIVFFSMATKKVMLYEMFRGKPGGVGIRNFWANSIADIIAQMESRYSYWEEVLYK
jgi:hypothetical protein